MKNAEELVIITKTYDLILWSCNHTSRFPRQHRFGLGSSSFRAVGWLPLRTTKQKRNAAFQPFHIPRQAKVTNKNLNLAVPLANGELDDTLFTLRICTFHRVMNDIEREFTQRACSLGCNRQLAKRLVQRGTVYWNGTCFVCELKFELQGHRQSRSVFESRRT
jgi:hypothetical protein